MRGREAGTAACELVQWGSKLVIQQGKTGRQVGGVLLKLKDKTSLLRLWRGKQPVPHLTESSAMGDWVR